MTDDLETILGVVTPGKEQLNDLNAAVNHAVMKAREIEQVEEMLKGLRDEHRKLVEHVIPEAMAAAGVREFKTHDGTKVTVRDYVQGSLPKTEPARSQAFAWLVDNGGEDLIKATIEMAFARGDSAMVEQVRRRLDEIQIDYTVKEDVHASTLQAFARERMRKGEAVPFEDLGIYAGSKAKIEVPE